MKQYDVLIVVAETAAKNIDASRMLGLRLDGDAQADGMMVGQV